MELRQIPAAEEILGPSPGQLLRRRIFGHKGLMIGGAILGIIILLALLAPLLSPHDPYQQSLVKRISKPFWSPDSKPEHPLGTDHVEIDVLRNPMIAPRSTCHQGIAWLAVQETELL